MTSELNEILTVLRKVLDEHNTENQRRFDDQKAWLTAELDHRFAEQNTAWKAELDRRFTEQNTAWKTELDRRFAEQNTAWKDELDRRFDTQNTELDRRFDAQGTEFKTEFQRLETKMDTGFRRLHADNAALAGTVKDWGRTVKRLKHEVHAMRVDVDILEDRVEALENPSQSSDLGA